MFFALTGPAARAIHFCMPFYHVFILNLFTWHNSSCLRGVCFGSSSSNASTPAGMHLVAFTGLLQLYEDDKGHDAVLQLDSG